MGMTNQKTVLVTGSAGFIGFHVAKMLLHKGWRVIGFDSMSDYYDKQLKFDRESQLLQNKNYHAIHERLEDENALFKIFEKERPEIVIHLAAQAGVRYSIDNPKSYLDSNIVGTFQLLEAARAFPPQHILMASTSSAYGSNKSMPHKEIDKSDQQMSFYAATKKATENIAHSYAHIFGLPITMFRFFTVYGPWGRPDMALFKFTKAMLNDTPIDVYNHGKMKRDFTYIDDLVQVIYLLISKIPDHNDTNRPNSDSISNSAPFRVVNIGNNNSVKLLDFIKALESTLGIKAKMNFMPMQAGDVPETLADVSLIQDLIGYTPSTPTAEGIKSFVEWYTQYFNRRNKSELTL